MNPTEIPKGLPKKRLSLQILANQDKEKIAAYLYVIFTLTAASFFALFALRPAISTISNLQKQLEDSKLIASALQLKLDNLRTLDQQYKQIENQLDVVYEAIPTASQVPQLTRQIENLTQQNGAILNSFSVTSFEYYPLESGKKFYSYAFTVNVQGSQEQINNFISQIISFNRLVSVDNITTGNSQDETTSATITGKAYFAEK